VDLTTVLDVSEERILLVLPRSEVFANILTFQGCLRFCIKFFWGAGVDLKERDHLEDLGVDGGRISKLILKKWKDVGGFGQDQDRDKW